MLLLLLCGERTALEVGEHLLVNCTRTSLVQLCRTHPGIRTVVMAHYPSVARMGYISEKRRRNWLGMMFEIRIGGPGHNIISRLNRISVGRVCSAHRDLNAAARTHRVTRTQLIAGENGCSCFAQMVGRELAAEAALACNHARLKLMLARWRQRSEQSEPRQRKGKRSMGGKRAKQGGQGRRDRRDRPWSFGTWNVQGLNQHTLMMLLASGPEETTEKAGPVDTWCCSNDILGITEMHAAEKHQRWAENSGGRFICPALPGEGDPADVAGLILSLRARKALLTSKGEKGGRVTWARIGGECKGQDIFVVATYIPHRARKQSPFQDETIAQLAAVLRKETKAGDQIILLGDFNARLARGKAKGVGGKGLVGAYTPHAREDGGGRLLRELMEEFGLFAPQTFFKPARHGGDRKGFGGATYVMEKRSTAELQRLGLDPQPPAIIDYVLCPVR
eukprot:SAG11_NODE_15_length_26319_cov_13.810564_19_plen_449_part_00